MFIASELEFFTVQDLPLVTTILDDPPDVPVWSLMEFRLVYWGEHMKAAGRANTRAWEKRQLRMYFHDQLKKLWETHPVLKFYSQEYHVSNLGAWGYSTVRHPMTDTKHIARRWEGFVPVVTEDFGMICELDILFLAPDAKIFKTGAGGGDLDNRLKTLLDALGIPPRGEGGQEIGQKSGEPPYPNPTFVLYSNDSLLTSIKVTVDELLTPVSSDPAEACVIIHTVAKTISPPHAPYGMSI
jgi:hypothetical protein